MNQDTCLAGAKVYEDLSRPGRYRVALYGQVEGDAPLLEDRLGRLGYLQVDADQWGASYRHRAYPNGRVEVDELPDESGQVRLVLTAEDLTQQEALSAGSDLERLYESLVEEPGPVDEWFSYARPRAGDGLN